MSNVIKRSTEHFHPSADTKMVCSCCGEGQMSVGILILLETIRTHFGKPVTIHSGPRCRAYNTKAGGAKNSEHLIRVDEDNDVADISVQDVTTKELHLYLKSLPYANLLGIGYYPQQGFCHIDLRGYAARW